MVYMCGRYTSTAAFDELASRFGITIESGTNEDLGARYNAAHSQTVPIITASAKGRRLVMAKWGFRPAWVTPASLAPINARAETAATTRLFATAIREGRCLVPATGFYDWKRVPGQKRKQPYHLRLKGGDCLRSPACGRRPPVPARQPCRRPVLQRLRDPSRSASSDVDACSLSGTVECHTDAQAEASVECGKETEHVVAPRGKGACARRTSVRGRIKGER